jgi:hypothetical protein
MKDYLKKFRLRSNSSIELVDRVDINALKRELKALAPVKSVRVDDEATISIKRRKDCGESCILKNIGSGKVVLTAFWKMPEKDRIAYAAGSTLWNDNKRGSHHTCAYITHKNLCTMEAHLNLEWGVTEEYLRRWMENFITSIALFHSHIESTKDYVKKLPDNRLSVLEKLEVGAGVADLVTGLWDTFDL